MSKRLADQLRETAREITPPDTAQTENAMAQAIKTLRRLQNEGEITLLVPGQGVRQN
jgi:flagellar motor switch protein FliG